ncbi:unnamed protein product [Owenia fusiformis]|uniref:Uncharacterized protein n=1 Tax=Owenia fusiformis TaxID=6347 RepID=A0A8J1TSB6_OWEFU|nr:unnamed protein product [Owenia fusiformis]
MPKTPAVRNQASTEGKSMESSCGTKRQITESHSDSCSRQLLSKRLKYAPICSDQANSINCSSSSVNGENSQGSDGQVKEWTLLSMPREILETIFSMIPYAEVIRLRKVCRAFDSVAQGTVNQTFLRLQQQLTQRFQAIKAKMPRRESLRRKHPLARESDIIETIHMRLTLLQMTFGKHIERKHCCFFPGEILDEIYRILRYIKSTPSLGRAYKVTDELFDLSSMAMEYFKEHVEPTLPEINYFATEFPDLATLASPATKTYRWQMKDAPTPQKPVLSPIDFSPQASPPSPEKYNKMRQKLRTCSAEIVVLKKDIKSCKNKMAHQQKQLIEANSKLEQHERRFDEQNKKFDGLLREFQHWKETMKHSKEKMCRHNYHDDVGTKLGSRYKSLIKHAKSKRGSSINIKHIPKDINSHSRPVAINLEKSRHGEVSPETSAIECTPISAKDGTVIEMEVSESFCAIHTANSSDGEHDIKHTNGAHDIKQSISAIDIKNAINSTADKVSVPQYRYTVNAPENRHTPTSSGTFTVSDK